MYRPYPKKKPIHSNLQPHAVPPKMRSKPVLGSTINETVFGANKNISTKKWDENQEVLTVILSLSGALPNHEKRTSACGRAQDITTRQSENKPHHTLRERPDMLLSCASPHRLIRVQGYYVLGFLAKLEVAFH